MEARIEHLETLRGVTNTKLAQMHTKVQIYEVAATTAVEKHQTQIQCIHRNLSKR